MAFNHIVKGQKQSRRKECGRLFHNEGHRLEKKRQNKKQKNKKKQDEKMNVLPQMASAVFLSPLELLYFNHKIVLGLLFAV